MTRQALAVRPGTVAAMLAALALLMQGCGRDAEQSLGDRSSAATLEIRRAASAALSESDETAVQAAPPTAAEPVATAAGLVAMPGGAQGDLRLVVHVRMAPGWHIHPVGAPADPASPTRLTVELPPGAELRGDWIVPPTRRIPGQPAGDVGYDGEARFVHELHLDQPSAAEDRPEVECEIAFQACNAEICRAPQAHRLTARLIAPRSGSQPRDPAREKAP